LYVEKRKIFVSDKETRKSSKYFCVNFKDTKLNWTTDAGLEKTV
jgi:hypothetical protein